MANFTPNYNLKKPLQTENYNVEDQNSNMDLIDTALNNITNNVGNLKTTADITYYINATSGSDSNDGLTAGTAFKTIQHAIDLLPQIINHSVNINVAEGTYSEIVNVNGFIGKGKLTLKGSNDVLSTVHTISRISVLNCGVELRITGFNLIGQGGSYALEIIKTKNIYCNYLNITTKNTSHGIGVLWGSNAYIFTSTISNKNVAIQASDNSLVSSQYNSGTDNAVGLSALMGGVIAKNYGQPNGSTMEIVGSGGEIR